MKKITFISDTHGLHESITQDLIGGDFLIHAGDISSIGTINQVERFLDWFNSLDNYKNKVFIAGNHDFLFEKKNYEQVLKPFSNVHYLFHEAKEIDGLKLFGTPYTPEFGNWAFNVSRINDDMLNLMNDIPEDLDVLITHGPPLGILDTSFSFGQNLGCPVLREQVIKKKPKIHVFGHIHGGSGQLKNEYSHFINASLLNEKYEYTNKPINIIYS